METASRPELRVLRPARCRRRDAQSLGAPGVFSGSDPTRATTSKPAWRRAGTWMRAPNEVPTTAARRLTVVRPPLSGRTAPGRITARRLPAGDEVALGAELLALHVRPVPRRVVGRVVGQPGHHGAADLGRGREGEVESLLVGHVERHALRGDEAGMDVVGGDAPVPQLDGQDPGRLEQAGLAHGVADAVAAHVEWVDVGHGRGHVEMVPLPLSTMPGTSSLMRVRGPRCPRRSPPAGPPARDPEPRPGPRPGVDGVVDQDVDVAPGLEHLAPGEADGQRVGQVHATASASWPGPDGGGRALDAPGEARASCRRGRCRTRCPRGR